ncbi:MAG: hypothetical protein WBA54_03320 [Acidaminobacteraceae bacterium]
MKMLRKLILELKFKGKYILTFDKLKKIVLEKELMDYGEIPADMQVVDILERTSQITNPKIENL